MKTININVRNDKKEMNSMIFGHFVEFMRDCIDKGMWSQILKNRGFDKKKDIPKGVVDGNPNVAEDWFRIGYKNAFEIALDDVESIARDGYAQKVRCFNDYGGFVGIAQGDLNFECKEYSGYIWMKAENSANVEIYIRDENHKIIFEKILKVGSEWNKYEFQFSPSIETRHGILEIRLIGKETIWLDGASIMPSDNIEGIWKDVYRHIKELTPPIIRYPGGCFADVYHFEDGIGEIDKRPYRANKHWGGYTDNSFGTDEFVKFCRTIGCEPMICINFGSGTPKEAADWVEYCNGSKDTEYGRLRAANGNPEPYNIKYWDVGNEIFGDWEVGHSSAEDYAKKYLEFNKAMKEKDKSIIFMTCGGDGDDYSQDWNQKISDIIKNDMDALCLHMYAQKSMEGKTHNNKDVYYATVGAVKKYEEILNESYKIVNQHVDKNISLAVTEYNLGTIIDSYREQTLEAAIFNAGMLNMFMRNCNKLMMCNYSDLVNGWPGGCIVSKNGKAFGTASYYVLKLYSESEIKTVLDVIVDSPAYSTKETIGNIEPLSDVPMVDAVAGINSLDQKVLFIVNRSFEEKANVKIGDQSCSVEITEIYSEKTSDMNFYDDMMITPKIRNEEASKGIVTLEPHSINRIRIF